MSFVDIIRSCLLLVLHFFNELSALAYRSSSSSHFRFCYCLNAVSSILLLIIHSRFMLFGCARLSRSVSAYALLVGFRTIFVLFGGMRVQICIF